MIGTMDSTTKPLARPEAAHPPRPSQVGEVAERAALRLPPLVAAMRPKQWTKNGLVFLALIFSIDQYWHPADLSSWAPLLADALIAFVAFTAVASAEYLVNDLRDIETDRPHPRKRRRPLAAGTLSTRGAAIAAVLLLPLGAVLAVNLGRPCSVVLLIYALQSLAYSYWLKHVVIVDARVNAIGFVLRAIGGAL